MELGKWSNYIAGGVGVIAGYLLNASVLKLGTRISDLLVSTGALGAKSATTDWMGKGIAVLAGLACLGFGWKQDGAVGYAVAGAGLGIIIEEFTSQ